MNQFQRIFHFHKWVAIRVKWYLDTSYNENGVKSTTATFICLTCGKIKITGYYNAGYITLEEFNNHIPTKVKKDG